MSSTGWVGGRGPFALLSSQSVLRTIFPAFAFPRLYHPPVNPEMVPPDLELGLHPSLLCHRRQALLDPVNVPPSFTMQIFFLVSNDAPASFHGVLRFPPSYIPLDPLAHLSAHSARQFILIPIRLVPWLEIASCIGMAFCWDGHVPLAPIM
jgi:hypothetical protein